METIVVWFCLALLLLVLIIGVFSTLLLLQHINRCLQDINNRLISHDSQTPAFPFGEMAQEERHP